MRFVYFRAEGCGVCHAKAPVAADIARRWGLPLEVHDVDTEEGREAAERLRSRTVPTLALVDGERVPFRLVGRMITPESVEFLMAKR